MTSPRSGRSSSDREPDENGRFPLTLALRAEHYPFWSEGRLKKVKEIRLVARTSAVRITVVDARQGDRAEELAKDAALGLMIGKLAAVVPLENGIPVGDFKALLSDQSLENLWIIITWGEE